MALDLVVELTQKFSLPPGIPSATRTFVLYRLSSFLPLVPKGVFHSLTCFVRESRVTDSSSGLAGRLLLHLTQQENLESITSGWWQG